MPGKLSIPLLIAILLMMSTSINVLAQNEIDYESEGGLIQLNIFHFEGSDKYDLTFHLSEQVEELTLEIKSYISTGDLSIVIHDPTGEEQGNFSVQGQADSKRSTSKNEIRRSTEMITTKMRIEKDPWIFTKETFKIMGMGNNVAQASISRSFRNPIRGTWTIRVICTDAKGIFTLQNNHRLLNAILGDVPSRRITGTVVDSRNRPLAGASIMIKGSSLGTVSDNKGNFSIPVRDNSATLIFHSKGMKSEEVAVGDQTELSVILKKLKQN